MAKRRKTRSQKIVADKRHVLYHLETPARLASENVAGRQASQVSRPIAEKVSIKPGILINRKKTSATDETFAYVITDIRKIILISSAVLVTQVVLLFVLGRI